MKIAFFDLETTGVYWNSDVPIQISAVIVDTETGQPLASFNEYIKTDHPISPMASKVNGISASMLYGCRDERSVEGSFVEWLLNNDFDAIGGHNITTFDIPMIKRRLTMFRLNTSVFDKPIIDTKELVIYCRKNNICELKQLGRKWSLVATANILGIETSGAHNALADVMINYQVYITLTKARREFDGR